MFNITLSYKKPEEPIGVTHSNTNGKYPWKTPYTYQFSTPPISQARGRIALPITICCFFFFDTAQVVPLTLIACCVPSPLGRTSNSMSPSC
ncbi:MAG: hypothetical protein SPE75_09765, partial [Prevotella sp.]|nr:hypothetical protein [Prevotella sp.]